MGLRGGRSSLVWLDAGLFRDGAEGAFRQVAGMVRDGGVAVGGGVEPDLVTAV